MADSDSKNNAHIMRDINSTSSNINIVNTSTNININMLNVLINIACLCPTNVRATRLVR